MAIGSPSRRAKIAAILGITGGVGLLAFALLPPIPQDPAYHRLADGRTFLGVPGYQTRAMYRGIFHHRPLVNGYGGYWPPGFRDHMILASRLPDPAALAALRQQTGLTTVVVNARSMPPTELATWQRTLTEGSPGLRPTGTYGDAVVLDARGE